MVGFLRSLWIWLTTGTIVLLWVPLLWVVVALDRDPLRRSTARWFRRLGPMVANVNPAWNVLIEGRENIRKGQAYVVVSNHQSLADIPLIAHLGIDAKWLAKTELGKFPVFGWMMRVSRDIFVDRSDRRKAAQALLQCARMLKQGLSVVFFRRVRGRKRVKCFRLTMVRFSLLSARVFPFFRLQWRVRVRRCRGLRGYSDRLRISTCTS